MNHLGGPIGGVPGGLPLPEEIKEASTEDVQLPNSPGPQQTPPNSPLPPAPHLNEGNVAMINLAKLEAPQAAKGAEAKPMAPQFANVAQVCILATMKGENSLNILEGLCKEGLSLDTPDPSTGLSPLAFAAMHASKDEGGACVKELVKLGASINATDAAGKTALMHVLENPKADMKSKQAAIHQLLEFPVDLMAKDAKGTSALGHAIRAGDEKLEVALLFVKELTSRKIDVLPLLENLGLSNEDARTWKNMLNTMEKGWLQKAPGDKWAKLPANLTELKVDSPRVTPEPQTTPRQYPELCNMPNSRGETPLHLAAKFVDDTRALRFLLAKGANPSVQERRGNTPLHIVAELGKLPATMALLQAKADPNLPNKLGHTAYDEADIHGSYNVTTALLDAGAKNRNLCDIRDSYTQSISLSPPIPEDGIHNPQSEGNSVRFKAFVTQHDKALHEALEVMMSKTEYVTFSDFETQFHAVIEDLNQTIPKGEEYIILVEPNKSNKWLAELGLARLHTFPKDILKMSQLNHELQQDYNKGVKHVVLLDDASYSGEQMCRFIRETAVTAFKDANSANFTITAAIPFVTKWARDKIVGINNDATLPQTGQIKLCGSYREMKPASEQVPQPYHALINDVYFPSVTVPELLILNQFGPTDIPLTVAILKENGFTEIDRLNEFITLIRPIYTNPANDTLTEVELLKTLKSNPQIDACSKPLAKAFIEFIDANMETMNENLQKMDVNDPKYDAFDVLCTIMEKMQEENTLLKHDRGLESRTLTVFDHKVADDLSLPPHYQTGAVYALNGDIEKYSRIFIGPVVYK